MFIVIPKARKEEFTGDTGKGAMLDPIKMKNSDYALSDDVLSDSAHEMVWDKLKELKSTQTPTWEQSDG